MFDTLVIIPTYNEAENLPRMLDILMGMSEDVDVLIVDDNSPDGTSDVAGSYSERYPGRIHIIHRDGKKGLGTAYVEGFQFGLKNGYDYLCEMDADFSHDPRDLPKLIKVVKNDQADMAVGSRYCNGISIINWPLSRLILSFGANFYARFVTGLPMADTTAGFKCLHRKVIEKIDVHRIRSNGYAFQIELHFRAWKAGFRIKEVSIIFRERKKGISKMSKRIVMEAIWRVWSMKFKSLVGFL